jgi:AraC-like DNA-binding protein
VPHLIRTAQIAALLFMPLSFLYVYLTFNPRPWKWTDGLHFLPALIFIADYAAFFLQPASEKIALYHAIRHNEGISAFGEGFFAPKGFHVAMRYLVMIGYWLAQVFYLRKAINKQNDPGNEDRKPIFNWLKWLTITQLIIIVPPIINLIFPFQKIWVLNQFSAIIASIIQGYFLFLKPEILYGLEGPFRVEDFPVLKAGLKPKSNGTKDDLEQHEARQIDQKKQELMDDILVKLESHLKTNKPFVKEGYGMPDLASELGFSSHQLSYLINKHYGMNFYSLINQYRIDTCKEKLRQREYRQKTLEAIARESGFHSRATFIRAFKMQTGITPSAFIKNLS